MRQIAKALFLGISFPILLLIYLHSNPKQTCAYLEDNEFKERIFAYGGSRAEHFETIIPISNG